MKHKNEINKINLKWHQRSTNLHTFFIMNQNIVKDYSGCMDGWLDPLLTNYMEMPKKKTHT